MAHFSYQSAFLSSKQFPVNTQSLSPSSSSNKEELLEILRSWKRTRDSI